MDIQLNGGRKMGKVLSSANFTINDRLTVHCQSENTSYGFRHLATLYENGYEIGRAKCTYHNRTWERFEFDTVMQRLESKEVNEFVENRTSDAGTERLKSIGAMSALFNLVAADTDIKRKNKFKKGLVEKAGGADFPDDWDDLPEEEKERRLDKALEVLSE